MKRIGVFLLLLDGMVVHRRLPAAFRLVSLTVRRYPFIILGGERHCEIEVSCPRTQQNDPARARTQTSRCGVQRANHQATASPTVHIQVTTLNTNHYWDNTSSVITRCLWSRARHVSLYRERNRKLILKLNYFVYLCFIWDNQK